jgi:Spy/CpxP family protein refolding chaperone
MKRSAFMTAIVVLGFATTAVTTMGQPASPAGPPPGYAGRPGMMGGPGGGPGMMGSPGAGPGMMGGIGGGTWDGSSRGQGNRFAGVLSRLGLTTDQQQKIATIHEDTRQKNWDAMGQLLSEQFRLSRLYLADTLDVNAIMEQQKKVDELRRVMLKSHIEMEIQIEALLTKDQRELLRSTAPWQMH